MPVISIIIPAHNAASTLTETLRSVLTQTHKEWECLIVENGSSDNTLEIAHYQADMDSRIRVLQSTPAGVSRARNVGIEETTGDYLLFLDADDLLEPTALASHIAARTKCARQPCVSYSGFHYLRQDGGKHLGSGFSRTLHQGDPFKKILLEWQKGLHMPPHCFMFDKAIFMDEASRFDTNLKAYEDCDCWLRIMATRSELLYVDENLALYRESANSVSKNLDIMLKSAEIFCGLWHQRLKNDRELVAEFSKYCEWVKEFWSVIRPEQIRKEAGRLHRIQRANRLNSLMHRYVPWFIQKAIKKFVDRH
ncbi:MAG: glycosyltransferase family 2 protein [Candidatus Nitrotoga sp.]|nr:glycosyltransferase family 2 protein [Candidatus Nitrotoga sp.]